MSRTVNRKASHKQNGDISDGESYESIPLGNPDGHFAAQNGHKDGESILRMEDHKRRTEDLLSRFQESHFFVRIAESGEPLWSKKSSMASEGDEKRTCVSAFVDRGEFDPDVAGGVARSRAKCCALPNGDIVVL